MYKFFSTKDLLLKSEYHRGFDIRMGRYCGTIKFICPVFLVLKVWD